MHELSISLRVRSVEKLALVVIKCPVFQIESPDTFGAFVARFYCILGQFLFQITTTASFPRTGSLPDERSPPQLSKRLQHLPQRFAFFSETNMTRSELLAWGSQRSTTTRCNKRSWHIEYRQNWARFQA